MNYQTYYHNTNYRKRIADYFAEDIRRLGYTFNTTGIPPKISKYNDGASANDLRLGIS